MEEFNITIEDNLGDFSKFLKSAGKKINKKAEERAEQIGVAKITLMKWEAGITFPEKEKLPKIAEVYQVDEEELNNVFNISKKAREIEKENNTASKFYKTHSTEENKYRLTLKQGAQHRVFDSKFMKK